MKQATSNTTRRTRATPPAVLATQARRLYSYIRFSDKRQSKGTSLERQTKGAREYAAQHGYVFDETLTMSDLGTSAFRGKHADARSEFGGFLAAVESGSVPPGSVLYVESLDRLSRQHVLRAMAQLTLIIERDVTIVTGVDSMEYSLEEVDKNPGIIFMALGIMMRANNESTQKSQRANDTLLIKCERWDKGERGFYIPCGTNPVWVKYLTDEKRWILDEEKAAPIRYLVELYREGYGGKGVLDRVWAKFGKSGGIGNQARVYHILRNRNLIGEKKLTTGGKVFALKDYYPPLLTEEEFASIQYLIDERGRQVVRSDFPSLFTGGGLMRCGYCRDRFTAINARSPVNEGAWHRGFRCMGNTKAGADFCQFATVRAAPIENAVVRYCADQINLSAMLEGNDPRRDIEGQLALARAEVHKREAEMKSLMRSLAKCEDEIQREFFESESREIARALKKRREEVAHLDRALANAHAVAVPAAADVWQQIAAGVDALDHDDRMTARRLIHETFKAINLYHRGFPAVDESTVVVIELISRRDTSRVLEIDRKTGELLREVVELADLNKKPVAPVARKPRTVKKRAA
jgi:DNA invertase Pin-like site-specific DNA recombinase